MLRGHHKGTSITADNTPRVETNVRFKDYIPPSQAEGPVDFTQGVNIVSDLSSNREANKNHRTIG